MTAKFNAILFDMDGVLMDSTPAHASAFLQVLRPHGFAELDYARIAGMRTREALRMLLTERGIRISDADLESLTGQKQRLAIEALKMNPALSPGCPEVLRHLSTITKLGLASSGSRPSVLAFLEASGAGPYFKSVLSGDDVANAKPDPEIFLQCASRLAEPPSKCLVVEDSAQGMEAARRGGFAVLAFGGKAPGQNVLGRVSRLEEVESYL